MPLIRLRLIRAAKTPPAPPPGDELVLPCEEGQPLTHAVYLSGLFEPPALCSGLGRCGRCRMRLQQPVYSPDMGSSLPVSPQAAPTAASPAMAPAASPAASPAVSAPTRPSTPLFAPPAPTPEDRRVFTPDELQQGWRLGCRHTAAPGMRLELPAGTVLLEAVQETPVPPPSPLREPAHSAPALRKKADRAGRADKDGFPSPGPVLLAVDLGTTSLHWRFMDKAGHAPRELPAPVASGIMVNPQMGAGSDVISRLAAAATPGGATRLQLLVLEALKRLTRQSAAAGRPVAALCLAANPAMTCLALGREISSLARAPYSLPLSGGQWEELPGLPPVWIPPQLSPFVGGDVSAGYAALVLADAEAPAFPFLLTDMGTNGEFLLALSPQTALVSSVPLGPALEGIGLPHGTEARPGAVTGFALTPRGLDMRFFDGTGTPAAGISGSGYISLLHCLLKAGALDKEGHFRSSPLLDRFFAASREAAAPSANSGHKRPPAAAFAPGEAFLPLGRGLRLYAGDVEEILKVKAAFSLGLSRLLAEAGLAARELSGIFLAGSLGAHTDWDALENLGFFPPGTATRLRAAGNASLAGAALLLRNEKARSDLVDWSRSVRAVDLAGPSFQRDFAAHMRFIW